MARCYTDWANPATAYDLYFFFLSYSDVFFLHFVGAEGCCCTWSHSVTHTHTHTLSLPLSLFRTSLDERSAHRRDMYPCNTQHSQERDIYAPSGIRTHNPSKLAAADPHLRPRGYRYQLICTCNMLLGWWKKVEWDGQDMRHVWGRCEVHRGFGGKPEGTRLFRILKFAIPVVCLI